METKNLATVSVKSYADTDKALVIDADGKVRRTYLPMITTETDPVFTASAAHGITSDDISAWDGALEKIPTEASAENKLADKSYVDSAVEEAKDIAKGRATGYVFDTKAAMDAWLADSTHVAQLVLGDNLYIKATDVPDYWWDGTQAQMLETQKVDLTEYVKNTDYATSSAAGVIKGASGLNITSTTGSVYCAVKTKEQYATMSESYFLSKGTLENLKTAITYTDEDGTEGTFYVL